MPETWASGMQRLIGGWSWRSRLRGAERQMWRHREAMGCVAAFLGVQEGDDLAEDGVREAADVVIFFHGGRLRGGGQRGRVGIGTVHSVDSKQFIRGVSSPLTSAGQAD